jgi:hypothetical protein
MEILHNPSDSVSSIAASWINPTASGVEGGQASGMSGMKLVVKEGTGELKKVGQAALHVLVRGAAQPPPSNICEHRIRTNARLEHFLQRFIIRYQALLHH